MACLHRAGPLCTGAWLHGARVPARCVRPGGSLGGCLRVRCMPACARAGLHVRVGTPAKGNPVCSASPSSPRPHQSAGSCAALSPPPSAQDPSFPLPSSLPSVNAPGRIKVGGNPCVAPPFLSPPRSALDPESGRARRHSVVATCSTAAGWRQWTPAPRDGHVSGSHIPAPWGSAWTETEQKGGSASRSLAEHLCCLLLPSHGATGLGGSPSPLCQQPPTRAS